VLRITYDFIELFRNLEDGGEGYYLFSETIETGRSIEKEVSKGTQTLISASGEFNYGPASIGGSLDHQIDFTDV